LDFDNEGVYNEYLNKFTYILTEFINDCNNMELNNYVDLLNNEDIVSSLFMNISDDITEYSKIYDVNIKIIDDIKIIVFMAMNIYKLIEKDVNYTKKYMIFYAMIHRFEQHLPSKNSDNKLIIKLKHMFTNLNTYGDLINNNGKFGIFQILKGIYNCEIDNKQIDNKQIDIDSIEQKIKKTNNKEISLKEWVSNGTRSV
jgi:hypothetical protein